MFYFECSYYTLVERGNGDCGRDALNNTSGECVVAKANEADCLANADVTREEGGKLKLKVKVNALYHI